MRKFAHFCFSVSLCALAVGQASGQASISQFSDEKVYDHSIVVTGTSIRGVAVPASPSVHIGREEIRKCGAATSSDIARTLPKVVSIGLDEGRRGGSGPDHVRTAAFTDEKPVRTRIACAFPNIVRHVGGPLDLAESYRCEPGVE